MRKHLIAALATTASALIAGSASAGSTLSATFFSIPDTSGPDFNICCSSPPATLEKISVGAALGADGLPVAEAGSTVADVNGSGEILWWTAGTNNGVTVTQTGTAVVGLPYASKMFAPNSTGSNNGTDFETAVLKGSYTADGSPVSLTLAADDDGLVYVDGKYVGGVPGVHGTQSTTLSLADSVGSHSVEIFYADRAQVDAVLDVSVDGATISGVPEPATWSFMILGVGVMGAALRSNRQRKVIAA